MGEARYFIWTPTFFKDLVLFCSLKRACFSSQNVHHSTIGFFWRLCVCLKRHYRCRCAGASTWFFDHSICSPCRCFVSFLNFYHYDSDFFGGSTYSEKFSSDLSSWPVLFVDYFIVQKLVNTGGKYRYRKEQLNLHYMRISLCWPPPNEFFSTLFLSSSLYYTEYQKVKSGSCLWNLEGPLQIRPWSPKPPLKKIATEKSAWKKSTFETVVFFPRLQES